MKRTIKSQTVEVTRKIVGERLGKLRCDNNLTQEGLAEIMDVSSLTFYKWESGKNWPTPPHLAKLAELYECSMDYLVARNRRSWTLGWERTDRSFTVEQNIEYY